MKVVGLIPFWMDKAKTRDIKKLAGKYLIEYTIELLNNSSLIEETIIYSSNDEIFNYVDSTIDAKYLKRPTYLDSDEITLEEIVKQFFIDYEADIVVLLHPYSPFIKEKTLSECIENVISSDYDSSFTAQEYKKFSWFKGEALNFDVDKSSPKLETLEPVTVEKGLLYVIEKKAFKKRISRVGKKPFIKIIDQFEGHEINETRDFEVAELIVNSGMFYGA